MRPALLRLSGTLAIAAPVVLLVYAATLRYGFHYDDYYFIKPYTRAEVLATFSGSWDHSGIMVPFYRPLTIAFHALRFELFGLNAVAHHAVSLSLFTLAAGLAGVLAGLLAGSVRAGLLGAVVFAVHPSMAYAQAVWITNQMHLLSSLIVLSGLIWWHWIARAGLLWWMPLLGFAAAAFLVKEDNIMLLPTVIVLHWMRRRLVDRSIPPVPRAFAAAAGVLVVALIALRHQALGALGGYGRPTAERAWFNYKRGITGPFWLRPPHRPWQPFASWFSILLPPLAAACSARLSRGTRCLLASGAAIGLLFNLPFIFVIKAEQVHLVGAGAALLITGGILAVLEVFTHRVLRTAAAAVLAGGIAAYGYLARHMSTDFEPYGEVVLANDKIVQEWAAVPHEIREYLRLKGETAQVRRMSTNPVDELDAVAFGVSAFETSPDGLRYRWMSQPRAEIFVAAGERLVEIPIRHEVGAFGPTRVSISIDGRPGELFSLADGEWHVRRYRLRAKTPPFARMHRITIQLPQVWVPSRMMSDSNDHRTLGLQIGEVRVGSPGGN